MHFHTAEEAAVLATGRHHAKLQLWVSDRAQGTDINPAALIGYRDTTQRNGYQGFRGGRITADLENPVVEAELRLALGRDEKSLSPYMTGGMLYGGRPLFDTGRYVALYAKCFAPGVVIENPVVNRPTPVFHGAGQSVSGTGALSALWPPHQKDDIGIAVIETDDEDIPSFSSGWAHVIGSPLGTSGTSVAPQFISNGGFNATAGNQVKPWPAGHQVGDIALLIVESANETISLSTPAGFVELPDSPQGTGTAGGTTSTRLAVFWCRATSTAMASPTIADPGDHVCCYMLLIRGCIATGNPFDVTAGDTGASSTSVSIPGDTTTVPNCLIVAIVANATDGIVAQASGWTNASLTDLQERADANTGSGNGGGLSVATGVKASAGAYSATTATLVTASVQARISVALKPASGGGQKTRLTTLWKRAASNNEPALAIGDSGDHQIAQIFAFRGCVATGNPWDVVASSVEANQTTLVSIPGATTTVANTLVMLIVTNSTASHNAQAVGWLNTSLTNPTQPLEVSPMKLWDTQTLAGTGGGHSVRAGAKATAGAFGATTATLLTASVQAKMAIALKPPPPSGGGPEPVTEEALPWRPIFVGRIDDADPAQDEGVLVLRCRDVMCDALDQWIEPAASGVHMLDDDPVVDTLRTLLAMGFPESAALDVLAFFHFSCYSDPNMLVPSYIQEPMSTLLAMRQVGLLNGWDLRGRWNPAGSDEFSLEYYPPDRLLTGQITTLGPTRYFTLRGLAKSRVEVRNAIEGTPSDPPRTPVLVEDATSIAKYGRKFLGLYEDAKSRIRTPAQITALVTAVLSDCKEPKVMAQVDCPFQPWVEVNDVYLLEANDEHHDTDLAIAISGYEHTFDAEGKARTVLNTRDRPAAANSEYRKGEPRMLFISTQAPAGRAPEGARWKKLGTGTNLRW